MATAVKGIASSGVIITDIKIRASEVSTGVPLNVIAQRYSSNQEFRNELYWKGPIFIGETGLESQGRHEIMSDGTFRPVDEEEYRKLTPERRSFHFPGTGPVAVGVYVTSYQRTVLVVDAAYRLDDVACEARLNQPEKLHSAEQFSPLKRGLPP